MIFCSRICERECRWRNNAERTATNRRRARETMIVAFLLKSSPLKYSLHPLRALYGPFEASSTNLMRRAYRIFFNNWASSGVRFPFVFSSRREMMSIVSLARGVETCLCPVMGAGSSPRWIKADLPREKIKDAKLSSTGGAWTCPSSPAWVRFSSFGASFGGTSVPSDPSVKRLLSLTVNSFSSSIVRPPPAHPIFIINRVTKARSKFYPICDIILPIDRIGAHNASVKDMSKNFDTLVEIMERLRGEQGRPWDRKQTKDSLKPYLIEEAYEVLEALEEKDPVKLK